MPWPDKVIRQFEKVPNNPSEADFHGAYNKLLCTLFPPDTDFTVVPQYMPASRELADFLMFEVHLENKPVFILVLRSPGDLRYPSSRRTADQQIRTRINDLQADCPLPVLHAVSAAGTKLCFYRKPCGQRIEPPLIFTHLELESDTAPQDHWDYDILEDEGTQRFQDVVDEIKQACSAL